jgi:Tol biopolymer transport system component
MNVLRRLLLLFVFGMVAFCYGEEKPLVRATWEMPPRCTPFAQPRIPDLKEELRETGYRLVIAIHPKDPDESKGESVARDLYIINADGSGLKQLTNTPDKDENKPRTSPDGKWFSYNYGDYLVNVKTLETKRSGGGYAWAPDSKRTVHCDRGGIIYTDMETGEASKPMPVKQRVSIADMSFDGNWVIFEIRNYLGARYTIDFMSSAGGEVRKMPNHPDGGGECHPGFSPDGKWMCWNAGGSLAIRRFDPSLSEGTDGKIITLPKELLGQDPCGRWSHCGRYIAYVRISHAGSWEVHSPLHIVRVVDSETIRISPPGWVGHHWDYDWLPPEEEK